MIKENIVSREFTYFSRLKRVTSGAGAWNDGNLDVSLRLKIYLSKTYLQIFALNG